MDVARLAGVSRGTVSLVLNANKGRVPISQETSERVIAAARQLNYSPNPVAQMLARGKNRILGFFSFEDQFPFNPSDFYNPYLIGIEQEAAAHEYNLILFTSNQSATARKIFQNGMNSLRLADGVILTGNYPDPDELRQLSNEHFPFVLIGRSDLPNDEIEAVVNDHTPTSFEAAQHLIQLGHRRIGFVANNLNLAYHQERLSGTQKAIDEASDAELVIIHGDLLKDSMIFRRTLHGNKITSLICADRTLVTITLKRIQEISLQVPGDISLVFLISNTWDLPYINPTRVNIYRDKKGRVAVQRLIKHIIGELTDFRQTKVDCKFIPGETTAPPGS